MNDITNCKVESSHVGETVGTIFVSIFKDVQTGLSSFCVNAENDSLLPVSYVIEDTLKLY